MEPSKPDCKRLKKTGPDNPASGDDLGLTWLFLDNRALTRIQATVLVLVVAVAVVGGGYYYYEATKPKPPVEMAVYAAVGERSLLEKVAAPVFLEKYNCKLLITEGLSAENLAKATAEKDNPVASVIQMDEGPFKQAKALGLCLKVTEKEIPTLAKIPKKFLDPDQLGVPNTLSLFGLWYDYKAFKEKGWAAPSSWYDPWDPKFKGRVVLPTASSTWSYQFAMIINRLEGGTDTKWDPGFKKIKTLVPNLHSFSPRSSNTMTLVQRGEAWIGPFGIAYAFTADREKGIPMAGVIPKEGGDFSVSWEYIPKNAKNLELAYKFVDFTMTAEYLAERFKLTYWGHPNPDVSSKLSGEFKQLYESVYDPKLLEKMWSTNWDVYAEMKDKFIERWSKEIETPA